MSNNVVGRWSSFAVFVVGVGYIVALVIGFTTRGLSAPIVDPLLAVMEVLTLIAAPLMLVMMAAIHGRARDERKTVSSIAAATRGRIRLRRSSSRGLLVFVEAISWRRQEWRAESRLTPDAPRSLRR